MSTAEPAAPYVEFSRLFGHWLVTESASLALAAPGEQGLVLVGRNAQNNPFFGLYSYPALSAVTAAPDGTLWLAQRTGLWKLQNGARAGGFRAEEKDVYLPRQRFCTGDLGLTDLAVDGHGALLATSGRYSVLGKASTEASLEPLWKPPFVTEVAPDRRCGLSGVGLYDGPRHCVSLWSRADRADGWKEDFPDGGLVMTVQAGTLLGEGLCLPCSPRWHPDGLYLINAGTAEFGKVDPETKRFVPLCDCPSYPTGLALHGPWAVISVSSRPPAGTEDLPLPAKEKFSRRGIRPFAGVLLVDLRTGDIAHNLRFESGPDRLASVAVLPGVAAAAALGPEDPKLDPLVTFFRPAPPA